MSKLDIKVRRQDDGGGDPPSEPPAPPPSPAPAPEPDPSRGGGAHGDEAHEGHRHAHRIPPGEQPDWLDRWENVQKLLYGFWTACGLLVAVDLLALGGPYEKHPHFDFDGWFGFYGFYGFVACVALVLLAKQLRKVVMRREDYYEAAAEAREREGRDG